MLSWLLVFSILVLLAQGVSSWENPQTDQVSEGLQQLFGNISQLFEKGILGRDDVFTMVSREEWGAEAIGCSSKLSRPVDVLVIHHIPGLECHNKTVCSQKLRELQAYHIHNSWCDVAYNFLVGDDGRVYEGVGWNVQGSHDQGYKNISLGVAFFGTQEGHSPSPVALSAMKGLISYAVKKGHLSSKYIQPLLAKSEDCLVPPQKGKQKKAACPHIVPRSVWGARDSHCSRMTLPAKYAIILHTAGRTCSQPDECRLLVRDLQSFFMNRLNACDIGYNFLVGQDGGVYEGVGWNNQGSKTDSYNDISLSITFMGTFTGSPPNAAALEAAQDLIRCAVVKGYLTPNYLLMGHSDVSNTLSPGQALYNIIKTWPHFKH
ncbi:peptidoglycan recognition protein 4 isoform 1 precursor [Mus musculus]|uniref:Peptidoglycan recognition protein 4 n=1 Tax=Mus musculus TaxID=10090 RepID=B7ZMZ4_MOUSE|nr:peptidoglycan recognition protein 4 isoform 1 precursor [Mus musculus]AAI44903.1 Pglyrp4 protein [Mus musculus]|eukprot:NP_001159440.1 peptidoglycan recognition protein 4 isoform 1 precursor [Mus musculus]